MNIKMIKQWKKDRVLKEIGVEEPDDDVRF